MTPSISQAQLERLSECVGDRLGLHFPPERWADLERGILSAASELRFPSSGPFIDWLLSSPLSRNQIEILASHLTVGETYFYRDKGAFEALEERVLPELVHAREKSEKRLRIWCAGCCTGEEAYSIAIAVSRVIPDLKDWNLTILATDINPRFLKKALKGLYSAWSFRGCPSWVSEGYFSKTEGGLFQLQAKIMRMVRFVYLNLSEDTYPSLLNDTNAMDLIFCRNVLMYFTPGRAMKVVQGLHRAMVEGGWIFVSPCEASPTLFHQFERKTENGTILCRKGSGRSPASDVSLQQDAWEPPGVPEAAVPESPQAVLSPPPPTEPAILEPSRAVEQPPLEAQRLYEDGRYEEAARMLEESIACENANGRNSPEPMALLARAYANMGELARASQWCEKAVAADRLDPGLQYFRATILQERGMMDEAAVSLKRALYLDQNFALAHFSLGNLAMNKGKAKEALRHFTIALSILEAYTQEEVVPMSGGMSAARLGQIVKLAMEGGGAA